MCMICTPTAARAAHSSAEAKFGTRTTERSPVIESAVEASGGDGRCEGGESLACICACRAAVETRLLPREDVDVEALENRGRQLVPIARHLDRYAATMSSRG